MNYQANKAAQLLEFAQVFRGERRVLVFVFADVFNKRLKRAREMLNRRERANRLKARLMEGSEQHQIKPIWKVVAWIIWVLQKWEKERKYYSVWRDRKSGRVRRVDFVPKTHDEVRLNAPKRNADSLLFELFKSELASFKKGDEQTHWANHKICYSWLNAKRYEENREFYRKRYRDAYAKDPEKFKLRNNSKSAECREQLHDCYVKQQIISGTTLSIKEIPPWMLELKREQIRAKRLLLNLC